MPPAVAPPAPCLRGATTRAATLVTTLVTTLATAAVLAATLVAARLPAQAAVPVPAPRPPLTGLTLSAPQQAALTAPGGRTRTTLHALYTQAGGRPGAPLTPARRAAFDSVVAAHNAALRALLTDEQRATFDANVRAVAAARAAQRAAQRSPVTRQTTTTAPAHTPLATGVRP